MAPTAKVRFDTMYQATAALLAGRPDTATELQLAPLLVDHCTLKSMFEPAVSLR